MPHVRDGELHAYLDGALDRLGAEVADRVRAHLAACEDCQARIDQEGALREQASAVLERALPGEIVTPPFEELLRRAAVGGREREPGQDNEPVEEAKPGAGSESKRRRGGHAAAFPTWRWAWAASVVLALGTGWMMGDGSLDFRNFPQAPLVGTESARSQEMNDVLRESAEEPSGAASEAFADERASAGDEVSADLQGPADAKASAVAQAPAAASGFAEEATTRGSARLDQLSSPTDRAPAPAPSEEQRLRERRTEGAARQDASEPVAAQRRENTANVVAEPEAVPATPPPALMMERLADRDSAPRAGGRLADIPAGDASSFRGAVDNLANATAVDGAPILIGGLPVLAVVTNPGGGTPGVLQQLSTGDSVLIVWSGDDAAAAEVERLRERQLAEAGQPTRLGATVEGIAMAGNEPARAKAAQEQPARAAEDDARVRRKVASSVADAMEALDSEALSNERTMGREEAWPTVVRLRRGSALLTVFATSSEEELRAVLEAAGLLTPGSSF